MELIDKYFTSLNSSQGVLLEALSEIYRDWNEKVNLISRKDMDHFMERHVLHSLAIAKFHQFESGSSILDVGTGGGFPGVPLAIVFPNCHFTLVDSIGKKIKVVQEVADQLSISNITAVHSRAEDLQEKYDFIVSRAVTSMPKFVGWTRKLLDPKSSVKDPGIWYLKGGDLSEELHSFRSKKIFNLSEVYEEEFFDTKKLVYLPTPSL